ncbi:MAG: hypothetical protein HUJ68_05550 [Clostridia bacterium]|nr:hypothetical protein [Clostridia bacterium]
MPNKYLKEYVESKNNKQTNYEQILSKVEGVSKMNVFKIKFTRIVATAVAILLVIVGIPQVYAKIKWNAEFTEFKNMPKEIVVGQKVDEELVDMNYIEKNGLKAKVESIIASADEVKIKLAFEFDENIEVNSKTFEYSYAIYDENNNIYAISNSSMSNKRDNLPELIYNELGVKYNKKDIYATQYAYHTSIGNISAEGRRIINELQLSSLKGFPKSKKLYVRILDLGYSMADRETKTFEQIKISNESWIFEINIPDKFYYSSTYALKVATEIEGFNLINIALSDTGLVLSAKDRYISEQLENGHKLAGEEFAKMREELIYITDGLGNRYNLIDMTASDGKVYAKFNVTKTVLDEKRLFLNITKDGNLYKTELVKE